MIFGIVLPPSWTVIKHSPRSSPHSFFIHDSPMSSSDIASTVSLPLRMKMNSCLPLCLCGRQRLNILFRKYCALAFQEYVLCNENLNQSRLHGMEALIVLANDGGFSFLCHYLSIWRKEVTYQKCLILSRHFPLAILWHPSQWKDEQYPNVVMALLDTVDLYHPLATGFIGYFLGKVFISTRQYIVLLLKQLNQPLSW